jgi:hypothetical protein
MNQISSWKKVLAVTAACSMLAAGLGAATSGTLSLTGNKPAILEITVTAEPVAANLPLAENVTDLPVGTVTERSNHQAGYTVTLSSANAMQKASTTASFRSAATQDFLNYSIKYGGVPVVFSAAGAAAVISSASAKTSSAGTVRTVTVSFDGASAFLDEAVYSDTLTFTIIAK